MTVLLQGAGLTTRYVGPADLRRDATYRGGKVGVLGVHLEAEADWYTANDLSDPDGVDGDLGRQFVHDLLE